MTDEGALVKGAKKLGYIFTGRTPHSVIIDAVSRACEVYSSFQRYVQGKHTLRIVPRAALQSSLGDMRRQALAEWDGQSQGSV